MEVPEGWGSKAKVPSGGGGEEYGYFLELHHLNRFLAARVWENES